MQRVECRYVAVRPDDMLVFDRDHQTMRVALTSEASSFMGEGWLERAVDEAYWQSLQKRYQNVEPEQADDPGLYYAYLTGYRRSESGADERARTVWMMTRLYPRLSEPQREQAQKWLADKVTFFADEYRVGTPGHAFHQAEAAWTAWLTAGLDSLEDRKREDVVRQLAVERQERRPGDTRYRQDTFPGFDLVGYGLKVLDQWAAAGHPMRNEDHPDGFLTFIYFVCPGPRDAAGEHSSFLRVRPASLTATRPPTGGSSGSPPTCSSRKDPLLVETAMVNFVELRDDYTPCSRCGDRSRGSPRLWEIATSSSRSRCGRCKRRIRPPCRRGAAAVARAAVRVRGSVPYLLSQLENEHYGLVPWKDFGRVFGELANSSDFARFLDQSDRAFWNAHEVWRALSKGWSRAAPLVSRLDGYLNR